MSLPCTGAYVCDAKTMIGERKGDGWVEEVVDLGTPEVVLEVESRYRVGRCQFTGSFFFFLLRGGYIIFTWLRLCSCGKRGRCLGWFWSSCFLFSLFSFLFSYYLQVGFRDATLLHTLNHGLFSPMVYFRFGFDDCIA